MLIKIVTTNKNLSNKYQLVGSCTNLNITTSGTHHVAIKTYTKIPFTLKNTEKAHIFAKKLKVSYYGIVFIICSRFIFSKILYGLW